MQRVHPNLKGTLDKKRQQGKMKRKVTASSSIKVVNTGSSKRFCVETPASAVGHGSMFTKPRKLSQSDADEAILDYIIEEMKPLSTTEKPAFRRMIEVFSIGTQVTVLGRKKLMGLLKKKNERMVTSMIALLSKQHFICMTADIWSCHNRSYLGMTVHFIDNDTLERVSLALACRRFKYCHDYKNIALAIFKVQKDFGIDCSKVSHIVTDNASNFGKAFRCFPPIETQPVLANESVEDDTDGGPVDIDEDGGDGIIGTDITVNIVTLNLEPIDTENDDESEIAFTDEDGDEVNLPPQMRCCSHTLNLLATSDAAKVSDAQYKRSQNSAFGKISALWNLLSRSTNASDEIETSCHTKFPVPNKTRWNSHYDAIVKLLSHKDQLNPMFDKLKLPRLKSADITFLEEYIKVMEPVATTLDILQGETHCFLGTILPALHVLKTKLSLMTHLSHCDDLRKTLLFHLDRRFDSIINLHSPTSKIFILASITHPQFKMTWIPENDKAMCKALFIQECEKTASDTSEEKDEDMVESSASEEDFFAILTNVGDNTRGDVHNSSANDNELQALSFLQDKNKKISMLESYPNVKKLFIKFNTTLPSSAPVERLFSSGGQIMVPRRCRLSDSNFETLLILKANKHVSK